VPGSLEQLLLGAEDWTFLGAVALRTAVMFFVILVGLRVMGKRGSKQLSVFELGVIVGLGSAAGDPMFYSDVGLLPCLIVFAIVLLLYHVLEVTLNKNPKLADTVEGKPVEVIRDGRLLVEAIGHEDISPPEMFVQLRLHHISHLGQIRSAILEPTGELSLFYVRDADVRPGLPVIPALFEQRMTIIGERAHYSCAHCAHTAVLDPGEAPSCPTCEHLEWTRSLDETRLT
jgi:uncharacterized membrane protein YcaP (DUF421 family)